MNDEQLRTFIVAEYFEAIYPVMSEHIPRERLAIIHKYANEKVKRALIRYKRHER